MKKIQTRNSIDLPSLVNSLKELGLASLIVGVLYFLEGIQIIDFSIYSPVVYAAARVAIEILKQYREGVEM